MGMPLDLYVIRHGESEANVIINAGEQGDNSLYTQDNVTVPDRSWRLTATGRKQADCIGRWLVAQQQLFDRYLVSPYVRTRETAATMALPKAKWEETRVLRERSWGEINTITQDDFRTNYARNWMFKRTDPLYWRPPAGEPTCRRTACITCSRRSTGVLRRNPSSPSRTATSCSR